MRPFLSIYLDAAIFVLLSIFSFIETNSLKIWVKQLPKNAEGPFPVYVRRSKRLCLSSLITVAFVSGCPTKASKKRPPTTGTQFKVCLELKPAVLVKNLETPVCVSPSPMLI